MCATVYVLMQCVMKRLAYAGVGVSIQSEKLNHFELTHSDTQKLIGDDHDESSGLDEKHEMA